MRYSRLPVLGVDIKSGSPRGRSPPRYSACLLKDTGEPEYFDGISLNELVALVRKLGEGYLATDNIFELVKNSKSLRKFLASIPEEVKLIQVTGPPGETTPLRRLAREAGLSYEGKPGSLESARLIAELAALGYGSEIVAFNPEYRVIISKNRSVKQGGSGNPRWRRFIEAAIQSEANRISAEFNRAGIDYDLYVEKGPGGLKRAEFIVYAPKEAILSVVKEHEWGPVKISIEPSWKKRIEFTRTELNRRPRPIMVGIDPGMSVGIAVMDLFGRLLGLETLRRASRSEVIETLAKYGRPILITTDVSPPPRNVIKIAQAFGAKLVTLGEHMKIEEKIKLVRDFEEEQQISVSSSHERDALAPLIKVYQRLKVLYEKAEAHLGERPSNETIDRARMYELLARGASIVEAIEGAKVREPEEEVEVVEGLKARQREIVALRRIIRQKESKIRALEEEVEHYRKLVEEMERQIVSLRNELDKMREIRNVEIERDRTVAQLRRRIRDLEEELVRRDAIIESLRGEIRRLREEIVGGELGPEWVPVKSLDSLARDSVEDAIGRGYIQEGDVVIVGDAASAGLRSAKLLVEAGVYGLIYIKSPPPGEVFEYLREAGVYVTDIESVEVRWRGAVPHVRREFLIKVADMAQRAKKPEEEQVSQREDRGDILSILWEYRRSLLEEESASH